VVFATARSSDQRAGGCVDVFVEVGVSGRCLFAGLSLWAMQGYGMI
jgi:hypothetical protein